MFEIAVIFLLVVILLKVDAILHKPKEEDDKTSYQKGRCWGFNGYYQIGWPLDELDRRIEKLEDEEDDFVYGAISAMEEIKNRRNAGEK